jgi:hypothetical protein
LTAATATLVEEHALLPQDIVMKYVLPLLELSSYTYVSTGPDILGRNGKSSVEVPRHIQILDFKTCLTFLWYK